MRATLLLTLALLAGCGGSDDGSGPAAPSAATVFQLQSGDFGTGTRVEVLAYIIAVSSDGSRVWISDGLAAGARTGMEVFRGNGAPALGLGVGDRVTVVGTLQEFGAGGGLTVTQLADPEFTLETPAGGAPIPLTGLDPAIITLDPIPGATANGEAYEGVLIQLEGLEVTATAPFTLSDGETTFGASNVVVALNDPVGTCYLTVTGIWNYDVTTDEWVIVPVTAGLVAGDACAS